MSTPPPAAPRRRIPIGRWIFILLMTLGVYAWTVGPYGVVRQWRADRELEALRHEMDSLRTANQESSRQLLRLQNDTAEIAKAARRQGLVRPGELLVRFVDTTETR